MRLLLFGSGLIGLIAMSRINTYSAVPSVIQVLFSRSGPLFLLLSLGLIALSEYHNEHSLAKSMPVSKFHLLNPLPAAVKGVILNVDLKGSEHLSRLSARLGHSGDLMETCLSHLWTAVSEHDGLVMQTEGDSLRALFADGDHNNSLIAAFEALDAMKRNLTKLSKRFASQGLAASLPREGLNFRASLAAGEIRPIWQDYGGVRLASWTETSGTNVFTDAARLLELERQIQSEMNSPASIVITPAELRARFTVGSSQGVWLFDRRSFVGKHGAAYEVAAYRVGEK
ncbi:MAG: hypothetical protein HY074_07440 [Deltaproteobacteria bacterium]|nr:hypothetical protein [Deltaproteobacteria bacterium]